MSEEPEIDNGGADVTASADLPEEFLDALTNRLEEAGIKDVNLKIAAKA